MARSCHVCPLADPAHLAQDSDSASSQVGDLEQHAANDVTPAPPPRASRADLPPRQREVVELASRGAAQKVIAYELGIAQSTVATHLRKALTRMDLSRCQLAAAMLRDGAQLDEPVPASMWDALTEAERAIVEAALRGCSNAAIAHARQRSVRTIANQLAAAYRKLSVNGRGELFARLAGRLVSHSSAIDAESEIDTESP